RHTRSKRDWSSDVCSSDLEGGASGFLATRLEELGRGLAAFADEQGPAWQDTVVVLISEFGRTFRENGNRGTDHGHGTVFWVLGRSEERRVGKECRWRWAGD